MDFASMIQEYRESGFKIQNLINALKNRLDSHTLSSEQIRDTQNRLRELDLMYYECMNTIRELNRWANK